MSLLKAGLLEGSKPVAFEGWGPLEVSKHVSFEGWAPWLGPLRGQNLLLLKFGPLEGSKHVALEGWAP